MLAVHRLDQGHYHGADAKKNKRERTVCSDSTCADDDLKCKTNTSVFVFSRSGDGVNKLLGHGASPAGNITRAVSQMPKGASGEICALSAAQTVPVIDNCK